LTLDQVDELSSGIFDKNLDVKIRKITRKECWANHFMQRTKFESLEVHNLEYYNEKLELVICHKFLESVHNHCWFSHDSLSCRI